LASNLACRACLAHMLPLLRSFWVYDSFQLVLLLIAFGTTVRILAGSAAVVVSVLIVARILCIYPGRYLYSFPEGMLI
jgi:hypothetical protein